MPRGHGLLRQLLGREPTTLQQQRGALRLQAAFESGTLIYRVVRWLRSLRRGPCRHPANVHPPTHAQRHVRMAAAGMTGTCRRWCGHELSGRKSVSRHGCRVPGVPLPGPVKDLCDRFVSVAPQGLVTGLYLTGGIGFGEWIEGQSDVDFVATLAHRPSRAEVAQLRATHEQMAAVSPIAFDGMHVLASDLAADPRELPPVPVVLNHEFRVANLDQLVAWHELAWHGVTVTGPELSSIGIWTDKLARREYTANNLDTYWRNIAGKLAASSSGEPEAE